MPKISAETVRRAINCEDSHRTLERRFGPRVARKLQGVFRPQERAEIPNQRWIIDHTRIDDYCAVNGVLLPRLWLTAVIDDCTSRCVGMAVSFRSPSAVQVLEALRNAILPKAYTTTLVGTYLECEWDVMGIPDEIVVDNGLDLNAAHVTQACEALGISIMTMPPNEPWKKGRVERFFRTLNTTLFHRLPGTTFGGNVN